MSAVELPNGRTYQFRYNSYGEVARIELPTGGATEYDWINANTIYWPKELSIAASRNDDCIKAARTLKTKLLTAIPGWTRA